MQFVEGRTVADVLATEHVVDPCRAAVIALEICEQLAKFHSWESAVVHGDIKPSNIHLGFGDTVRLLDFGIAKTLRADCNATEHQFGSPSYCSPERLTRAEVDPQSDLWALGATLYEMLAGVPPYQAEDTRKLEGLIRSKRPPRALPASCPAGLRAIVMKSLAPDARQAVPVGGRVPGGPAALPGAEADAGGDRAAVEVESRRDPGSGARGAAARHADGAAQAGRAACRYLGAAAYFATGMLLWIGGTLGWQVWQARASAAAARPSGESAAPTENLAQWYVASADRILEAYRTSPDPWLYEFDWPKAEICLERAVQLGASDDRTLAKLALARGYATLERLNGAHYSENAAAAAAPQGARRVHAGRAQGAHATPPRIWRWRGSTSTRCPIPRRRWRSLPRRNGAAPCWDAARSSSRAMSTAFARSRNWRATGGGPCAMPMWRAASTAGFPASMKPTGICARWTRSTPPAPRKPRHAEVLPVAVTRSWTMAGTAPVMVRVERTGPRCGFAWLAAASLLVATGLWFVYQAKVQRMAGGAGAERECGGVAGRTAAGAGVLPRSRGTRAARLRVPGARAAAAQHGRVDRGDSAPPVRRASSR